MTFTRTFWRSGFFVLLGVVFCILAANGIARNALLPLGVVLLVFSVPAFAVSATRHLLRGILWRVGSRLFVSYLLLTLPVFLIVGVAFTGLVALTGQIAARRVEAAFLKRTASLGDAAHELAAGLERAGDAASRRALFHAAAREKEADLPRLGAAWVLNGRPPETAGEVLSPDLLPRSWIASGRRVVIARQGKTLYAAAIESRPGDTIVLTLPLGREFRQTIERETGAALVSVQGATVTVGKNEKRGLVSVGTKKTSGVSISDGTTSTNIQVDAPKTPDEATPAPGAPSATPEKWGLFSSRWVAFPLLLPQAVLVWETGIPAPQQRLVLFVRSSVALEYRELFGHLQIGSGKRAGTGDLVIFVMGLLSVLAGFAYALATLIAGVLVLRIARATGRLSAGFAEIEKGNFGARAELKGRDQLAELIASFNRMGAHLSASVAERAEKEAIEHELDVARDLQRRLLPPADFSFPGFEIAVDFRPAAVIGGDFYDLVAEKGKLTVVVADVSGHGLPTGIVMAAAKASLSALARSGATGAPLLTQLDEEILRTTDSRTFVTLAHLEFRVDDGTVVFTNAGHLYPYRVTREGVVSALENPARPLGLALPATFRAVTAPLAPGDLWIVLSDGIIEATARGSDEEFGFERLEAALARSAGMTAETVKEQILSAWRTFTRGDEPEDDRTLVVLRVRDEPPGATV